MAKYAIGLDYGTNSVRALIANVETGEEVGTHVWGYAHGDMGVVVDSSDPNLARQHPLDYIRGIEETVTGALKQAASDAGVLPEQIIGIGVDTTGSTPLPVDEEGTPLAFHDRFRNNPAALAWLWKDHTAHAEASEITERAKAERPHYLAKCGGVYSSEWYWSKILRCRRSAPEVFDAAHTWVEIADWIPAVLSGTTDPAELKRCVCAAGHKAMFNKKWGGYPDQEFLGGIDPALEKVRSTLPDTAYTIADKVGTLTREWAAKLGLPEGIPVAAGAFDAHFGAVGSGIRPGTLVKIIGTSTCDIAVAPLSVELPDIPGLCGIVPESVLPGCYGLEAGQSAVGDIFNWYVHRLKPGAEGTNLAILDDQADELRPGESGLLALDWHNGNRTILVDQRLSGMLLGLTLHSTPAEIYRALVEATAFGARVIVERFEEYGVKIERVVNCGGISFKSPLTMQIYADIMKRPLEISRSSQTCALGAVMAGAVVAGKEAGGHADFDEAAQAMSGMMDRKFVPIPENVTVYDELYVLYRRLHDSFGTRDGEGNHFEVMKKLLDIRDSVRAG